MGTLLVARAPEVDAVRAALDASPAGIVVYGEAGVGKTALVRHALHGLGVRYGGALATLHWAPYLPIRRALDDDLSEECWNGDAAYVAEQVAGMLGGDILHVDDVQWADPATREVLGLLVGRCPLVTTVRRGDPGAPAALEQLVASGLPRLDLEPLGPSDAAELVRRLRPALAPSEVASLVVRSGGNPLLIEELADADGNIATLHRAILARCRQLGETQLEDLALVVLADRPLPVEHLADPGGLVESGIVVEQAGRVAVRHALIGEVVDDLIPQERQRRTHRRLAAVLTHPGERARHLLAAGEHRAAHVAAMTAVADAATPGERIAHLEVAALCVDPVEGAEFRLRAAEQASAVDLVGVAATLLDGLPDRPELRHRVARQRYLQAVHAGDTAVLEELAAATAAAARPGTAEEVLALMDRSSAILSTSGAPERLAQALALAERAVELSERIDAERSAALKALADALWHSADDRWRTAMPAALRQARAEGNLDREWRVASNWISALQTYGPIHDALTLAEEMVAKFDALRLVGIRRNFEIRRVDLLLNLADYPQILATVPDLLRAPGLGSMMMVDLECILAEAELATGRLDSALARLAGSAVTSSQHGRVAAHRILAEAHLDADRPELAARELDAFDTYDVGLMQHTMVAPARAWTAFALDRPAPERPQLLPRVGKFAGVAAELDGVDAVRRGDLGAAALHFARAADDYRDMHVARMVRCAWFAGEALRRAGDPDAEAALLVAEQEALLRGMVAIRMHCERSLRTMGVRRSAPVVRSAGSPLTEREHEVANLVAGGLTDGEIATRLGVQRRTVQTLLANARTKLGAGNRAHLVRLVTEGAR